MSIPHDLTDLYLAPVTLQLDARIQALGALSVEELAEQIALDADADDSAEARAAGLLGAVTHRIALHGWAASWDERGIRLSHANHTLVLGVPDVFHAYRAGDNLGAFAGL